MDSVDLVGETIDLSTGSASFYQTDISIPGNSPLNVSLGRKYIPGSMRDRGTQGALGDWVLNVPSISVVVSGSNWHADRCSGIWGYPGEVAWGEIVEPWKVTHGVFLNLPNGESSRLYEVRDGNFDFSDYDFPTTMRAATHSLWAVSCITLSDGSEGFIAHGPNGTTVKFETLVYQTGLAPVKVGFKYLGRKLARIMATQVSDLAGNTVSYNYDSAGKLLSITSNDQRTINLYYDNNNHLDYATANGKTWDYQFVGNQLNKVVLPDGRNWEFSMADPLMKDNSSNTSGGGYTFLGCADATNDRATGTTVIHHPNGLTATFELQETTHPQNEVPKVYELNGGGAILMTEPCYDSIAVKSKTLSGPGMSDLVWNYQYSEGLGSHIGESHHVENKWTDIIYPNGVKNRQYFKISYDWQENQLYRQEWFDTNGIMLSSSENSFVKGKLIGITDDVTSYANVENSRYSKRKMSQSVTQNSDIYTVSYSNFDSFERALTTISSNNFATPTLTQTQVYSDYTNDWVLGLPRQTTINGVVTNKLDFCTANTSTCRKYRPSSGYKNGVKVVDWTYQSDGNYKTIKDANNKTYTFSNYYRGLPRTIYAPGVTPAMTAVVNADGTIASVTDFNGNKSSYLYDDNKRLTQTTFPLENGASYWLESHIDYQLVDNDDYGGGIVSGQWKQVITHGNYRMTRYFDALMRTVLVKEEDLSDESLTRYQNIRYDAFNRVVFKSVQSSNENETVGNSTSYDALGRVVSSTSPLGITSISYLSGNRKQVTNPRYGTTTYTYQAFGSPAYDSVTKIESPEGVVTEIDRDVFGKKNWVKQTGGGVSSTRNYYYDSRQQLCRTYHPETGYTAMHFDDAGLLTWELIGTNTNYCNSSSVPGSATQYTYTGKGELASVNYPSGSTDLSFTYDNNGNQKTAYRSGVHWDYDYNSLNQLGNETLTLDGRTFSIDYGFDGRGQVSDMTYPSGCRVEILPNAFGQATRAGSYASNASYHPSGPLKQFTYGNGKVYNATLNAEMLPLKIGVTSTAQLSYGYDANANVTSITDHVVSGEYRSMTYDALDRLKTANGPWGSSVMTYDGLSNIKSKTLGSKSYTFNYDTAKNRLTSITGSKAYQFEYDANANVTSNGHHSFTFDKANLMLNVNNGSVATYNYDAQKRRVKVTEGGQTTYQVYTKGGQFVHKLKATGSVPTDYIRLSGQQIAKVEGAPGAQAPVAPGYITVPESSATGNFSVTWPAADGATSYTLQEKKGNGSWVTVYSGSGQSKYLSGRSTADYQYQLRSCSSAGCSQYRVSSVLKVSLPVSSNPPSTPSGLTSPSTDADGSYTVSWNSVSNVTRYELEEKKDTGNYLPIYSGLNLSVNIVNGATPASYIYRVRACNNDGCSAYSTATFTDVEFNLPGGGRF